MFVSDRGVIHFVIIYIGKFYKQSWNIGEIHTFHMYITFEDALD